MWPSAASLVYYVGIGTQAVLAVFLGQRLGVRPRVAIAITVCYLLGMVPGAKILFNVHQGTFALTGLLRQDFYLQGLWGGPLVYLALAVPAVWLMTRKSPEPRVLSANGGRRQLSVSSPQSSVGPGLDLIALTAPIPMAIAKLACLCAKNGHG